MLTGLPPKFRTWDILPTTTSNGSAHWIHFYGVPKDKGEP